MSQFLLFSNIHLGIELLGAIIFFIVAWLFFEAYRIKKDAFSLLRTFGFLFFSAWQLFHLAYSEAAIFLVVGHFVYVGGLAFVLLSYLFEKLPARPKSMPALIALPPLTFFLSPYNVAVATSVLLLGITFLLIKRYFTDIDKQLKWLAIGFMLLFLSSLIPVFVSNVSFDQLWILEHLVKLVGFIAVGLWGWLYLSLRAREETLIIFVGASLFIALLVTTTFSFFLFQKTEDETRNTLAANSKILNFYIDSLKSKALAASQIIAGNEDFVSAIQERDISDLTIISDDLMESTGQGFLTVAGENGNVFFKANIPIVQDENVLAERIGAEALEGRPAVTIERTGTEGFSIRAAAPLFDRGKIVGTVLTGFLLDNVFARTLRDIIDAETTIFIDEKVVASSILDRGEELDSEKIRNKVVVEEKEFLGTTTFLGQEVIGSFQPIKNLDDRVVAILSITTTPGELLGDVQAINRLTMAIIFLVVMVLAIPLYRFSVFLAP